MINVFLFLFIFTKIAFTSAEDLSCLGQQKLKYICGPINPEDLYHVPESPWIFASGMGPPGNIYLINNDDKTSQVLHFRLPKETDLLAEEYRACPSSLSRSEFTPIGLSMRHEGDDKHQLYVINRGRGEPHTIEVFNIAFSESSVVLEWAGCVVGPKNTALNSVVPVPHGGIAVTSSYDPRDEKNMDKFRNGDKTGKVFEWFYRKGWANVEGGELSANI